MRKTPAPSQEVIDNDNLGKVVSDAESHRGESSVLKFLMQGESKSFQVSVPDATCSLSFTANAKSLLSSQYSQMDLPANDMLKLAGPAVIEGDALQVTVFNGTDWHVSEVAVALTMVKKPQPREDASFYGAAKLIPALAQESEVRPERNPDTTILYRMRAAAPPFATTVFSAPLNTTLAPDEEWHWAIVQAKGYPPQIPAEKLSQALAPTQSQPQLPTALEIPQSLSADPSSQNAQ